MTEKEIIATVRLVDLYGLDKCPLLKYNWEAEHFIELAIKRIRTEVKYLIDRKISKYKKWCKKTNKRQYLIAYK